MTFFGNRQGWARLDSMHAEDGELLWVGGVRTAAVGGTRHPE